MPTKEKAPRAGGALNNTSFAGHSSTPNGWIFSPVRRAAYEAEQRALEHFANIAEAMPDVARKLTAELIPSEDDGVIRMIRRLP